MADKLGESGLRERYFRKGSVHLSTASQSFQARAQLTTCHQTSYRSAWELTRLTPDSFIRRRADSSEPL